MQATLERETELYSSGKLCIMGVDEAGRGPLAGPVVAGAVWLPPSYAAPHYQRLNDSKQLNFNLRELLYQELCQGAQWGVGICEPVEIDTINIRQASWVAMQRAVRDLCARFKCPPPCYVLVDGTPFGDGPWPYEAMVKGDSRSLSIAAASVIAKVTRDRIMVSYDAQYPGYGFARHKGYPCPDHLRALESLGPCPLHRRSFAPVRRLLEQAPNLFTTLPAD